MNLALKVALVVSVTGLLMFLVDYTRLTKGRAWRDPIGLTLIFEALFSAGMLIPLLLASFFHLSPLGVQILSWSLIGFMFAGGLVMFWRTWVFEREHKRRPPGGDGSST